MRLLASLLKQAKLVPMLLMISISTGCTTTTQTSVTDVQAVCEAFPAITYSRKDTGETQRQVIGFNAARNEICRGSGT